MNDKNYGLKYCSLSKNDQYLSNVSRSGFHYSTTVNLFSLLEANRENKLMSFETANLMCTPKVRGCYTLLGYGIDMDRRYAEKVIDHSDGWFGVRTALMHFKNSG